MAMSQTMWNGGLIMRLLLVMQSYE